MSTVTKSQSQRRRERRRKLHCALACQSPPLVVAAVYKPPTDEQCTIHVLLVMKEHLSEEVQTIPDLQEASEMYFRKRFIKGSFAYRGLEYLDTLEEKDKIKLTQEQCVQHCVHLLRPYMRDSTHFSDEGMKLLYTDEGYRKAMYEMFGTTAHENRVQDMIPRMVYRKQIIRLALQTFDA